MFREARRKKLAPSHAYYSDLLLLQKELRNFNTPYQSGLVLAILSLDWNPADDPGQMSISDIIKFWSVKRPSVTPCTRKIWTNFIKPNQTKSALFEEIARRVPVGDCEYEFKRQESAQFDHGITFLLDGSESISRESFAELTRFTAKSVADLLGGGILDVRVNQFSDILYPEVKIDRTLTPIEVVNRLSQIPNISQVGGNSNIRMAIEHSLEYTQHYKYNTIVLLTDGLFNKDGLGLVRVWFGFESKL